MWKERKSFNVEKNYSETSSEISDNLSLAETDSEYESFAAYISACLDEIDNKEKCHNK